MHRDFVLGALVVVLFFPPLISTREEKKDSSNGLPFKSSESIYEVSFIFSCLEVVTFVGSINH